MKVKQSPKKNYIYNLIYQILILIIPLIVAPYLSRKIGAEGIGIYTYTYSIIYYFVLITMLGVNNYGNRTIAKVRDNKEKLSKAFWSIYYFQLIMGIIMLIIYLGYIYIFNVNFKSIALIQSFFIVAAILDINWFFFGIEEFKKTIIRNSIVKIMTCILIFLTVKSINDVWKYALIMSGMTCISQLMLWGFLNKYIKHSKVKLKDIIIHIKPNLILFIPVIAVSLYKMMDKIMLGIISGVTEVGYYENGEKIINVPLTFITALGTVMLPRMSNLIANDDDEVIKKYIFKSINFVMFLSYAMCFGLIAIGYDFAPLFFGKEFQKTGYVIMLLALTLPFISFANVLRTQYLIPKEKDKTFIVSVFLGAIINLIMNVIFIRIYGSIGACYGTIAAEFSVMLYQSFFVRKLLPIKKYITSTMPFLTKAAIMFIIVYALNKLNINNLLKIFVQMITGCTVYFLLNLKYINQILNIKNLFKKYFKNTK